MNITVKGRGTSVTPALEDHIREKLAKVTKVLGKVDRVEAILIKQSVKGTEETHKAELTIHAPHTVLRAEETTVNMYASIDIATTKLERQARRLKERRTRKGQSKGSTLVKVPVAAGMPAPLKVVRTKAFELKPMNVEDAAHHLDMVGHDFYVFTNAESMRTNVLYRRKDGNLGLIEPAR